MKCYNCGTELIWGGDHDCEEHEDPCCLWACLRPGLKPICKSMIPWRPWHPQFLLTFRVSPRCWCTWVAPRSYGLMRRTWSIVLSSKAVQRCSKFGKTSRMSFKYWVVGFRKRRPPSHCLQITVVSNFAHRREHPKRALKSPSVVGWRTRAYWCPEDAGHATSASL